MTHLDAGQVQAWLHGEVDERARAAVEAHLEACPACREMAEESLQEERWFRDRMSVIDVPPPAPASLVLPLRTPRGWPAGWRHAAAILIAVGVGGAVWALPVVRTWVAGFFAAPPKGTTAPARQGSKERSEAEVGAVQADGLNGVAIVPGSRFIVSISSGAGVSVRARLSDRVDLVVTAYGGRASFESREGEVVVAARDSARVDVEVPRGAPLVEIHLGGRRVLTSREGAIGTASVPDSSGWYLLVAAVRSLDP